MSKLIGKLLCRELNVDVGHPGSCFVKYIKSDDSFVFKWNRGGLSCSFKTKRDLALCVSEIRNSFNWMYEWSIGYKTMVHLSDVSLLRRREMNYVANMLIDSFDANEHDGYDGWSGRKALIVEGWIDNDSDFDNLCMIMYLFCLSATVLKNVVVTWKRKSWGRSTTRWIELATRTNFGGRVVGALGKKDSSVDEFGFEDDASFNERIAHNKKVALDKGFLAWYLEACKEECKRQGLVFNREEHVRSWDKLRALRENVVDF